jgi:hypothetical protein
MPTLGNGGKEDGTLIVEVICIPPVSSRKTYLAVHIISAPAGTISPGVSIHLTSTTT